MYAVYQISMDFFFFFWLSNLKGSYTAALLKENIESSNWTCVNKLYLNWQFDELTVRIRK